MRRIRYTFLLSLFSVVGYAQLPGTNVPTVFFSQADSGKLFFRTVNLNFFKNNEYFNPLNEGETLPGATLDPTFVYHPGPTTRLETGVHLLKYFGQGGLKRVEPIVRFQYQPVSYFQMVLGTLFGGVNHGLIEPLYEWQNTFTQPLENGVQFLFNTPRFHSDTWLDWKRFIEENDPYQEELTFGTTLRYELIRKNTFYLSVPLQTTVNHHGGQIIANHVPLRTIGNVATAITAGWDRPDSRIRNVRAECWFVGFRDMSQTKLQVYKQGFGVYPKIAASIANFQLQAGYFRGEGFMASEGEPLFFSATIPYNENYYPERNLVTAKLIFQKQIQRGITLQAYAEVYKELKATNTDYDYGVHLLFDRSFFITRL